MMIGRTAFRKYRHFYDRVVLFTPLTMADNVRWALEIPTEKINRLYSLVFRVVGCYFILVGS